MSDLSEAKTRRRIEVTFSLKIITLPTDKQLDDATIPPVSFYSKLSLQSGCISCTIVDLPLKKGYRQHGLDVTQGHMTSVLYCIVCAVVNSCYLQVW